MEFCGKKAWGEFKCEKIKFSSFLTVKHTVPLNCKTNEKCCQNLILQSTFQPSYTSSKEPGLIIYHCFVPSLELMLTQSWKIRLLTLSSMMVMAGPLVELSSHCVVRDIFIFVCWPNTAIVLFMLSLVVIVIVVVLPTLCLYDVVLTVGVITVAPLLNWVSAQSCLPPPLKSWPHGTRQSV